MYIVLIVNSWIVLTLLEGAVFYWREVESDSDSVPFTLAGQIHSRQNPVHFRKEEEEE